MRASTTQKKKSSGTSAVSIEVHDVKPPISCPAKTFKNVVGSGLHRLLGLDGRYFALIEVVEQLVDGGGR